MPPRELAAALPHDREPLFFPYWMSTQSYERGHGPSIVHHLIAEAVLIAQSPDFSDLLFLDVYMANRPAIALYEKCGFVTLNPDTPVPDPQENNEPYFIMAKKLAVGPG